MNASDDVKESTAARCKLTCQTIADEAEKREIAPVNARLTVYGKPFPVIMGLKSIWRRHIEASDAAPVEQPINSLMYTGRLKPKIQLEDLGANPDLSKGIRRNRWFLL